MEIEYTFRFRGRISLDEEDIASWSEQAPERIMQAIISECACDISDSIVSPLDILSHYEVAGASAIVAEIQERGK